MGVIKLRTFQTAALRRSAHVGEAVCVKMVSSVLNMVDQSCLNYDSIRTCTVDLSIASLENM